MWMYHWLDTFAFMLSFMKWVRLRYVQSVFDILARGRSRYFLGTRVIHVGIVTKNIMTDLEKPSNSDIDYE